jgi:phosphomannomutase
MSRHQTATEGPLVAVDLAEPYRAFIRRFLKPLRPMKVVIDASNGMAGKWMPILFDGVENLELITLNMEHAGEFSHDPNPLVDENLKQTQAEVKRTGADLGACFDGDADRCMFVDERAQIIRCDILTALLAGEFLREVPGAHVVYDLRSSRVVAEEIQQAGGQPLRGRVGHSFMKQAMAEVDAVFAGELSGHFYFRDNWYCDSGFLAFAHTLNILSRSDGPLSALIKPLKRYHGSGERNFENEQKNETIDRLSELYADGEIDFLDGITIQYADWWFNVRKSNTEPLLRLNLEAKTKKLMTEKVDEVAQHLGTPVAH